MTPRSTTHPFVVDVALAFDPSKSPYYKLVCIRRSPYDAEAFTYQIDVYTSKSHTWNKELTLEPSHLLTSFGRAFAFVFLERMRVYWNNAIYWCLEGLPFYCCFDIAKRETKILDCPATHHRDEQMNAYYWCLQESNGHLFHVALMKGEDGCELVAAVWELDDDHHWLLRHRRVLTSTAPAPRERWELPRERWELMHSTSFIYLMDTCSLLVSPDGWMRVYSLNTGSYEDFLDATNYRGYYFTTFQFGVTLALV